jgi:hypothetical protein
MADSGEVRTARELGITDVPPYILYSYVACVECGRDEATGMMQWITKRKWVPLESVA